MWDRCSENALTPNGLLSDEAAAPSSSPAARAPGSLLHHWAWSCSPRSVSEARAGSGNSQESQGLSVKLRAVPSISAQIWHEKNGGGMCVLDLCFSLEKKKKRLVLKCLE